jgi:hypothetical protein
LGGLFGFFIGDTVRFVSRNPLRLLVSGRTGQLADIAAERVTIEDIDVAAQTASQELDVDIEEVSVLPMVDGANGRPRHLWFIELRRGNASSERIAAVLDREIIRRNQYYRDLRTGTAPALDEPQVRFLSPGTFARWLTRTGRIGGQHKIPRVLTELPEEFAHT